MSAPEIENGVKMPPVRRGSGSGLTDLIRKMKVGDSLFFKGGTILCSSRVLSLAKQAKLKFKFSGRTVEGGCRVWRVK